MFEHPIDLNGSPSELGELVDRAARSGEEVVLTREGEAVAKIVPLVREKKPRRFGSTREYLTVPDDFDSPDVDEGWLKLTEQSFAFWDNEEDSVYDVL
ncbi:MAG TPA: hypothetical protein VJT67_00415 [Longimicrobiaceae bacterium]|nr:hypothetical protein [Longimicrobiaceae bacterium]